MAFYTGTSTQGSTGVKTILLGFQPSYLRFTVCERVGGDTVAHMSIGRTDGTRQNVTSTMGDSFSRNNTAKVISHWESIGGVPTEVLAASFDSFTASGFKLNVSIGNPNYQIVVEAFS